MYADFVEDRYLVALFGAEDVRRGMEYYSQGRVTDYRCAEEGQYGWTVNCSVRGTWLYSVRLRIARGCNKGFSLKASCNCFKYMGFKKCKHVAAAMIAFRERGVTNVRFSDGRAARLIGMYLPQLEDAPEEEAAEPARLVPAIDGVRPGGRALTLSFKIGRERLYVVRNLDELLQRFSEGAVHEYGKQFTFRHIESALDERGRATLRMIRRVRDSLNAGQQLNPGGIFNRFPLADTLPLMGESFERFFDAHVGEEIERRSGGRVRLVEDDPKLRLRVEALSGGARLSVQNDARGDMVQALDRVYMLTDDALMRLSREGAAKLTPLIKLCADPINLGDNDLTGFCGCVLPEIQDLVAIDDPSGALEKHLPDPCTPRYHLDMENDTLTCRLSFDYGGTVVGAVGAAPGIARDLRVEGQARNLLMRHFSQTGAGHFAIHGEAAAWDFLCTGLGRLRESGEVYLSQTLMKREFKTRKPAMGVSVSGGMLTMDFDTGGFPPEELEALYEALLLKKKYYRLQDGRVLPFGEDTEGLARMAEIAHMTQLDAASLEKGRAQLPASRGLYLDDMLRDEALRVNRDATFRQMVRRFKTVADSDYALPEGLRAELRGYQATGYRWLKTLEDCHFGGILADEMGLGKTLQTIALLLSHFESDEDPLPCLVVCPTSLIYNWRDEFERFAPSVPTRLIVGAAAARQRLIALPPAGDVWVTSYELLRRDIPKYEGVRFHCCVLDEGQFVKNRATQASKAVKQLEADHRLVLTGTPVENRLSELWNLFDFLMPGYLFSHNRFVERLEKPILQNDNAEAKEQLRRLVRPFLLRRLKGDVLSELPPKEVYVRRVMLSEPEKKAYAAQVKKVMDDLGAGPAGMRVMAGLTRLRQICCDPGLCFENYEGPTSKQELCLELLASMVENGHQVLLFSQFTAMLERLSGALEGMGITHFVLQGSTSKEDRAQLVKRFNAGEASVMLISLKAGGTGLNLTAADVVIHYDPWWNQAAQDQATDRAHRIGQKSRVQVYKLIAMDTIEERILELQEKKAGLLEAVTEAEGKGLMDMSPEELSELLRLPEGF